MGGKARRPGADSADVVIQLLALDLPRAEARRSLWSLRQVHLLAGGVEVAGPGL